MGAGTYMEAIGVHYKECHILVEVLDDGNMASACFICLPPFRPLRKACVLNAAVQAVSTWNRRAICLGQRPPSGRLS